MLSRQSPRFHPLGRLHSADPFRLLWLPLGSLFLPARRSFFYFKLICRLSGKGTDDGIIKRGAFTFVEVVVILIPEYRYPECKKRYRRIKTRRGHKKAIITICRMLLTAIWNILSKLVPYCADGFMTQLSSSQSMSITKAQGLQLLRMRGYFFKDDPDPSLPV